MPNGRKYLDESGLAHYDDTVSDRIKALVTGVSGVKGNAETDYRTGNVNITPANIGAQPAGTYTTGVKGNSESSYRSGDVNLTAANIGAVAKSGDTMTGNLVLPALKTSGGRVQNSGDDEGIVVTPASNNWAGVCLGNPSGRRSVFYFNNDTNSVPRWRYNNGSSNYDILHPGKAGTIELTGHTHNYMPKTTVLYDNSSGTNGTVSLSASAANYNHMRIYFRINDHTMCDSVDVYQPNNKTVSISALQPRSSVAIYAKTKRMNISGTSLTVHAPSGWAGYAEMEIRSSDPRTNLYQNNTNYILRVEGWNE